MLETIEAWDQRLFLFLNGFHNAFFDTLMYWITYKYTWYPLYLLLIIAIISKYRWQGLIICLTMIFAVSISDQITSGFMKPYFGRLRPCYDLRIQELVHVVAGCGGKYGFASSHSSTTFGLATTVWLALRQWSTYFRWAFLWAGIIAYSRIYVGVHYPVDILIGACVGIIVGWLMYLLYLKVAQRLFYRQDHQNTSAEEPNV